MLITNSLIPQPFSLESYDYHLPEELIAQTPLLQRTDSRLMVIHRSQSSILHTTFCALGSFLKPGDLLVLNNTKVIPARLLGKRKSGGKVELLLLEKMESGSWKVLVRPGRKIKTGHNIFFEGVTATVIAEGNEGEREVQFEPHLSMEILQTIGRIPLPPYIHKTLWDDDRYQTAYAQKEGAVAAPTAGLHFTTEYLEELKRKGIKTAYLTLHVGAGTFKPVLVKDIRQHSMHGERYYIPKETIIAINEARAEGKRVIAVGTTSARALEAAWLEKNGKFLEQDYDGKTNIFIYPGYRFNVIQGLLTNFHLPRSTLLMMVSAFCGTELIRKAYQEAIKERYRFFSFGDAMLIL